MVIFLLIFILLFSLAVIAMKDFQKAPAGEKRIYFAVLCALPFLAEPLLWSILAAFANNSTFSITGGNTIIQFFMAVVEEFIICGHVYPRRPYGPNIRL